MSRFIWGNTDGSIWVDKPYTPAPFIMSGITPSTGTPTLTVGRLTPQDTSFTIDWGDGTIETFETTIDDLTKIHTYAENSHEYTISITGAKVISSGVYYAYYNFADWTTPWITSVDSWGQGFFTTSIHNAFRDCSSLVSIPDSWAGLDDVIYFNDVFINCSSLVSIPSSWTGLENVITLNYAFYGCTSLVALPTSWVSLESVINFEYAFQNCTSLTTLPASWIGLDNVTSFHYSFNGCSNLISIPISWIGLESVTSFNYAFTGCVALVALPVSWIGLENVLDFTFAFKNCTSLVTIGITDYTSLSSTTNCQGMFEDSLSVTSDILGLYNQLVLTVSIYSNCFTGLTLAENYASIPDSWKGF